MVIGNAADPRITQPWKCDIVVIRIDAERFEHQLTMFATHLMTDRFCNVISAPARFGQQLIDGGDARFDAPLHQFFRIGFHQRCHFVPSLVLMTLTQIVVLSVGRDRRCHQAIIGLTDRTVGQDDGTTGRTMVSEAMADLMVFRVNVWS